MTLSHFYNFLSLFSLNRDNKSRLSICCKHAPLSAPRRSLGAATYSGENDGRFISGSFNISELLVFAGQVLAAL